MQKKEIIIDEDDVLMTNLPVYYCRYCGSKILSNSNFCSTCGKSLSNTTSAVNQANPQYPVYASQQPQQANQTTVIVNDRKSNGVGTAGFIFALMGIIFSWVPVVDFIVWFLGAFLSFIGLFKAPRGLAITGFILSIIGIIIIISIFGSIAALLSQIE